MNSTQRIIKRYPNRRLYDTQHSRYVTLAEVREYVLEGTPFVVFDVERDSDITTQVLLQTIAAHQPVPRTGKSREWLCNVIRGLAKLE